jgi:hypothetical protein
MALWRRRLLCSPGVPRLAAEDSAIKCAKGRHFAHLLLVLADPIAKCANKTSERFVENRVLEEIALYSRRSALNVPRGSVSTFSRLRKRGLPMRFLLLLTRAVGSHQHSTPDNHLQHWRLEHAKVNELAEGAWPARRAFVVEGALKTMVTLPILTQPNS